VGRIRQLETLGYLVEASTREPREETILEPADDKAIVSEEFFAVGLLMPLHLVLTDILVKFQVQLHQLSLNASAQLSMYFWAVMSFGDEPSSDGFVKRYELHYQPKKVIVDSFERFQQFDILNLHARRGGGARLTLAIKNKWTTGWTKAWFRCKVPLHVFSQGGKSVHDLRSHMSGLHFRTESPFDCPDNDLSDAAFVWASKFIRGRDAVEEFVPCSVRPLGASVSFDQVLIGVTPVLKLKVPVPDFVASHKDDEDDVKFLARVELDAKVIAGSCTHSEHDSCITGLHNEGHLNRVLGLTGVAYGPHSVPDFDAFTEASKTSTPWGKISLNRPSDTEVASVKSIKLSRKTVPHAITAAATERTTLEASGLKSAAGASGSKIIGGTSGSKSTAGANKAFAPVKKCRIPVIGAMAGHLWKSLRSHDCTIRRLGIQRMKLPRGQSLVVNLPEPHCPTQRRVLGLKLCFKSRHPLVLVEFL
jgi:hypothetical protein